MNETPQMKEFLKESFKDIINKNNEGIKTGRGNRNINGMLDKIEGAKNVTFEWSPEGGITKGSIEFELEGNKGPIKIQVDAEGKIKITDEMRENLPKESLKRLERYNRTWGDIFNKIGESIWEQMTWENFKFISILVALGLSVSAILTLLCKRGVSCNYTAITIDKGTKDGYPFLSYILTENYGNVAYEELQEKYYEATKVIGDFSSLTGGGFNETVKYCVCDIGEAKGGISDAYYWQFDNYMRLKIADLKTDIKNLLDIDITGDNVKAIIESVKKSIRNNEFFSNEDRKRYNLTSKYISEVDNDGSIAAILVEYLQFIKEKNNSSSNIDYNDNALKARKENFGINYQKEKCALEFENKEPYDDNSSSTINNAKTERVNPMCLFYASKEGTGGPLGPGGIREEY